MNLHAIRALLAPGIAARGYDADALYVASGCLWYGQRMLLRASDVNLETITVRLERLMREEFPPTWETPPVSPGAQNEARRAITESASNGAEFAVALVALAFVAAALGWILRGVI